MKISKTFEKLEIQNFEKVFQATAIEPVKEETLAIEQMSNVICLIFTEIRYDVDSYRVSITESDSLNSIPMVQKVSSFSNEQEIRVSYHFSQKYRLRNTNYVMMT